MSGIIMDILPMDIGCFFLVYVGCDVDQNTPLQRARAIIGFRVSFHSWSILN